MGLPLVVPASEAEQANAALAAYESENSPAPQVEDEPHGTGYLTAGITVATVLLAFFLITGEPNSGNPWFKRGSSDAAFLLSGGVVAERHCAHPARGSWTCAFQRHCHGPVSKRRMPLAGSRTRHRHCFVSRCRR